MDPEKPETVETEAAPQDDGMVEVHQAEIADLDEALKRAQEEEAGELANENAESESAPPPTQTTKSSADDATGQPAAPVATEGATASAPDKTGNAQGDTAEVERLRKRVAEKELFIQHRGNELGTLRQTLAATKAQLQQAKSQLENGLEDRFAENPVQASNDRDRIKEINTQLEGLNSQEERAARIVEAQTLFLRHIDIDQVTPDDMAAVLKESDGIGDEFIAQFKANPWEWTTPEALIQLGKRAMDRKEFVKADSDRRLLARHVLAQNQEIARLRARPGQVVSQLQKNLNQAPSVSAQASSTPKSARELDPTRMTIAELDAALKHASAH